VTLRACDLHSPQVSKKPLQLYVNTISGALRYAPVGWLPPNSVSINFYKTGEPSEDVGSAYFSWPLPEGRAKFFASVWWLCPMGPRKYKVYISDANFGDNGPGGIQKDTSACRAMSLSAIEANPWGH